MVLDSSFDGTDIRHFSASFWDTGVCVCVCVYVGCVCVCVCVFP